MIDRVNSRDRRNNRDDPPPPIPIKRQRVMLQSDTPPTNDMPAGIDALERRFDALLQHTPVRTDAVPPQRPLDPSPLIPRPPASTTEVIPAPAAQDLAAQQAPDAQQAPQAQEPAPLPAPSRQAPGKAQDAEDEAPPDGSDALPELATPGLDPFILSPRLKRKLLQQKQEMQSRAEDRVTTQQEQRLRPSDLVAFEKAPAARRDELPGAIDKTDVAPRNLRQPPRLDIAPDPGASPEDLLALEDGTHALDSADELSRQKALADSSSEQETSRHSHLERHEVVAAEAASAQAVQTLQIAQRNTPESLPLHVLKSI